MKNYQRLFVAAPLPDFIITELETYTENYDKPGVRILPQENWHLTFHFIGNVDTNQVAGISSKLKSLSETFEPFHLKLLRVAPGPNKHYPRLIWAVFSENKTFEKITRAITIGLGAKMENQHPIPHVTLARFAKDIHPIPKLPVSPARETTSFEITEIDLWQSELRKPHPQYSILDRFPFGLNG